MAFQPHVVEESVGEFLRSFVEALVIVLVVSFLSLGWRTGVVVALSVPLVLAIVLVVMNATGMDLDRISLGALILALGLLVDDAIISVEMMVVKMEEGWDRVRAATFAWTSTAFPMLSGTLVTAAGFLPVGFSRSVAGEYAGGIFWVVGIALVASWVVAVVFTPYLGLKLLPDYASRPHHQGRFILILGLTRFRATSRGGIRNVVSPPRRSYVPSDGTRKRRCSSRRPSSASPLPCGSGWHPRGASRRARRAGRSRSPSGRGSAPRAPRPRPARAASS